MKVVAVVSAKGGVGKTTICANLAAALNRQGLAVMAADLDPQNALHYHFPVDVGSIEGLSRAALSGQDLRLACIELANGIVVLPFGRVNETDRVAFEALLSNDPMWLRQQLARLPLAEDAVVILDTPPGPSVFMRQALTAANLVMVITLADAASYVTLPLMEGLIETYCLDRPDFIDHVFVINQVNRMRQLSKDVVLTMQSDLGDRVVSLLHQDQAVSEALASNQTVLDYDPYCQGTEDFMHTAQWLIDTLKRGQRRR